MKKRKTSDVRQILERITDDDPVLRKHIAVERLNLRIARMIRDARIAADLTQQQLADLLKTSQSAIARIESADYEGHSLAILQRIAAALDQRLEIRFVSARGRLRRRA